MQESCFTSGRVERESPAWSVTVTGAWTLCGIGTSTATVAVELLKTYLSLLQLCQTKTEVKNKQTNRKPRLPVHKNNWQQSQDRYSGRHLYFSIFHWEIYPCRCLSLNVCRLAVSIIAKHTKGVIEPSSCVCVLCMVLFLPQLENMHLKFTLGVNVSEWLFYLHVVISSRVLCTSHQKAAGIDPPPTMAGCL